MRDVQRLLALPGLYTLSIIRSQADIKSGGVEMLMRRMNFSDYFT